MQVTKGISIERERDGTYAIYFSGHGMYATRSGYASEADAKAWLDKEADKHILIARGLDNPKPTA